MGDVTIDKVTEGVFGNRKRALLKLTMSNSYATGGDGGNIANSLGFENIEAILVYQHYQYTFSIDTTNNKVLAYSGGSEVASATDLSAVSFYVEVYGW